MRREQATAVRLGLGRDRTRPVRSWMLILDAGVSTRNSTMGDCSHLPDTTI